MKKVVELINPSDPITFIIDDQNIILAGIAVAMLSPGYGLKDEHGNTLVGVMTVSRAWAEKQGIGPLASYVESHSKELADVLSSYLYGTFADRVNFDQAIDTVKECRRLKFRKEWNSKKRSSMNDIGDGCDRLVNYLLGYPQGGDVLSKSKS